MIQVTLYKRDEKYIGMQVSGHAGYAEAGSDIVCASISTLVINCMNSIEYFAGDPFEEEVREEDGFLEFKIPGEISAKSELLILSTVLGLRGVEAEYEDCISIGVQEV